MKGSDAFCPKTGAPLSEERHYTDAGFPKRAVLNDEDSTGPEIEGELTTGKLRSSKIALFNYFRRCHQQHYAQDQSLYRKALLELRRLKRTATGNQQWDIHIWYVLEMRLDIAGYDTRWMHSHARLRCPRCSGHLKFRELIPGDVVAHCSTHCTNDNRDQLVEIRELLAELYSRTYDDVIDETEFLQFAP